MIAIFTRKALLGEPAVIFGDGQQTRDFVHVSDVVAANLSAAAHPGVTGPLNIGTGHETTMIRLADTLTYLGHTLDYTHAPSRAGEVRRSALDCSAAREQLGWRARRTLRAGLSDTLAWAREQTVSELG